MNILQQTQDSIRNNEPISRILQEALGELNFKPSNSNGYYYNDAYRADMFTKVIALVRDYAKQNGN